MSFLDYDLFDFWRWFLAIVCTVYTVVLTWRWAWDWWGWLATPDRQMTLLRHYLVVQLLRVRAKRFAGELARIGFWGAAFAVLLYWHYRVFIRGA